MTMTMTMTKISVVPSCVDLKALLRSDEGGFRGVLQGALQASLEAAMPSFWGRRRANGRRLGWAILRVTTTASW